MRKVYVSDLVWDKVSELESYLLDELKLSEKVALQCSSEIKKFISLLSSPADYPLCRFKRWRILGYRCAIFKKDWIFAYEVFKQGVIVRDMCHAKLLKE